MPDLPELPDFPDLVRRASETTEPPRFEALVIRARSRRRGQAMAATALTVLAVVAVAGAVVAGHQPRAAGPVAPPSQTPSPMAKADRIIAHGGAYDFAIDNQGDLLTLWSTCATVRGNPDAQPCEVAWKLVTKGRVFTGALPQNSGATATSANGGFVVEGSGGHGTVVMLDGSTEPLRPARQRSFDPGEVVVETSKGLEVADAKQASQFRLTTSTGAELVNGLVSGETVWAQQLLAGDQAGATLVWSQAGGAWQRHPISGGGTVAGVVTVSTAS